jgi:hypothetical protein
MKNKPNPLHQKETEFHGSFQAFTAVLLSPDDPTVKARVRKGRPADVPRPRASKKRGGKKPKK